MKVVNDLARQGLLETTHGRGGGLRLLAEPETVRIGDVVHATETDPGWWRVSTPPPTPVRCCRAAG